MEKIKKYIITVLTSLLLLCNFSIIFADEPIEPTEPETPTQIDYSNTLNSISDTLDDIQLNIDNINQSINKPLNLNEYYFNYYSNKYNFFLNMFDKCRFSTYSINLNINKDVFKKFWTNINQTNKHIIIFLNSYDMDKINVNQFSTSNITSGNIFSSSGLYYRQSYTISTDTIRNSTTYLTPDNVRILYLQLDGHLIYDGLTQVLNEPDPPQLQPTIDLSGIENLIPVIIVILLFLLFKNLIWGV